MDIRAGMVLPNKISAIGIDYEDQEYDFSSGSDIERREIGLSFSQKVTKDFYVGGGISHNKTESGTDDYEEFFLGAGLARTEFAAEAVFSFYESEGAKT